ncbi:MAG: penicillin-binding transpeptidase domain-containing protein [Chloroflexota bacterium]|nr:penicillin-binding transpeptidase domain-containing protein [Chloroflexota bacterium]
MNRRISRLALLQLLGLSAAGAALGYWQIVRAPELVARADNPRRLDEQWRTVRGRMLDRRGRPIALSEVAADGYVRRVYLVPTLGAVTGFMNPLQGMTGLERAYDDHLSGRTGLDPQTAFARRVLHRPAVGSDLVLTIDLDLQAAAERALATGPQVPGAVIALDPRSGAVRALATTPTFDPNRLTFDPTRDDWNAENAAVAAYAAELNANPARPLLNRATQGLYPPGSTFKTVTLAAALERRLVRPDHRFRYELKPPDRDHRSAWHHNQFVSCQNHSQSEFDLAHAFAFSCNVAFADLGTELGASVYLEIARGLGMDQAPPFELPVEVSRLASRPDFFTGEERFYAIAATAMGQGEILVTPLQMALIAAAMASGGQPPVPYLVEEIRRPDGSVIHKHQPRRWTSGVSSGTAAAVRDIMVTSVNDGWASGARLAGAAIGGKTGTAELGVLRAEPHAWFIGFATADTPRIALALIKESSGMSSAVAAPAARIVFEAALSGAA